MDPTEQINSLVEQMGENPTDPEGLIPELREYYEEGSGELGRAMLRSPFVYQIPYHSWKMANESHKAKTEEFDRLCCHGDYARAIWLLERPYRLGRLLDWLAVDADQSEEVKKILPDVWKDTESPHQHDKGALVKAFRMCGFQTDTEDGRDTVRGLLSDDNELRVYRGIGKRGDPRGMSWTTSVKQARWFADRFSKEGRVYTARVASWGILGYLTGRGEDEVVVDPDELDSVRRVAG